jgi:L-rhamnose isomerase / sugar isomerase
MSEWQISADVIAEHNKPRRKALETDYAALGEQLARRGIDIGQVTRRAAAFHVAVPSWGVGTGGTRFARFPGVGEPRNVMEKLDDCSVIHQLCRATPRVSLHIPWDKPRDPKELKDYAASRGLGFDAMNSNTFQDQADQRLSYKFGSLSHTDAATRQQAVEHNLECIEIGQAIGSKALTVWIADGSNFPGQSNFTKAFERYLDSARAIYAKVPADWKMFIEHKMYEPAFYSTVIQDWGTNYLAATSVGDRAFCLVDLGHHAPNVNIEMIVARLVHAQRLGGFHFNDSKYGDDDLDAGSIEPFRLFLVFNELVEAELSKAPNFNPAHMLDQSHNVTDPIESLMTSAIELQRAYAQALIVERKKLHEFRMGNDVLMAAQTLKRGFTTDVSPILAQARVSKGGAIDPVGAYRDSGYRIRCGQQRPGKQSLGGGIV